MNELLVEVKPGDTLRLREVGRLGHESFLVECGEELREVGCLGMGFR